MIHLTNPLNVSYPALLIMCPGTVTEESATSVRIGDTYINLKNPTKSDRIKGRVIKNINDLFRVNRRRGDHYLLVYNDARIFKLNSSIVITSSVRKIKCITDKFFMCDGYTFPIDHDIPKSALDEYSNSLILYAKLGIWNHIPIFLELVTSYGKSNIKRL